MERRRNLIILAFVLAFAAAFALIGIGLARRLHPEKAEPERTAHSGSDKVSSADESSSSNAGARDASRALDKLVHDDRPKLGSLDEGGSRDYPKLVASLPDWQDSDYLKDLIREGNDAADKVLKLNKEVQDKLRIGLLTQADIGEKGSGSRSKQLITSREKRLLRWTMVFTWRDGEDYLQQLRYFDAILAIPQKDSHDKYWVIRDLDRHPAPLRNDDLTQLKRIFWIDDRAESVKVLSQALGLKYAPARVVSFFPEELEKQLLQLELNYKGAKEEDILETRFAVRAAGPGKYEPIVESQKMR
jgi:hypothetical protein